MEKAKQQDKHRKSNGHSGKSQAMEEIKAEAFRDAGFVPGAFVRNPDEPDWGLGQVQSVVGHRVTVNFEERGKLLINTAVVTLVAAEQQPLPICNCPGRD